MTTASAAWVCPREKMGRAALVRAEGDAENRRAVELNARIDALLAEEGVDRASVEGALADGYARVLVLEAEKLRLERRLLALARSLGTEVAEPEGALAQAASRVSGLAMELAGTTNELGGLRGRLAALRRRAGGARAA